MKISIIAIGRAKAGPEADLVAEYLKRLPWQINTIEVEEKRPLSRDEKIESEGQKLLAAVPRGNFVVAMDKGGKNLSSEDFAKALTKWRDSAQGITILIGGAEGFSEKALSRADFKLSMGAMTFPHLFARAMLVEQLYRAYAIHEGHPYHK